jgi:hypothetical protein
MPHPSIRGWDIVGTWPTGQRRSRADCCGHLNSGADLGKRSAPAVLEEFAVLSHSSRHKTREPSLHHRSSQVSALSTMSPVADIVSDRGRHPRPAGCPAGERRRQRMVEFSVRIDFYRDLEGPKDYVGQRPAGWADRGGAAAGRRARIGPRPPRLAERPLRRALQRGPRRRAPRHTGMEA